jgi:hypothetical protein
MNKVAQGLGTHKKAHMHGRRWGDRARQASDSVSDRVRYAESVVPTLKVKFWAVRWRCATYACEQLLLVVKRNGANRTCTWLQTKRLC